MKAVNLIQLFGDLVYSIKTALVSQFPALFVRIYMIKLTYYFISLKANKLMTASMCWFATC